MNYSAWLCFYKTCSPRPRNFPYLSLLKTTPQFSTWKSNPEVLKSIYLPVHLESSTTSSTPKLTNLYKTHSLNTKITLSSAGIRR